MSFDYNMSVMLYKENRKYPSYVMAFIFFFFVNNIDWIEIKFLLALRLVIFVQTSFM